MTLRGKETLRGKDTHRECNARLPIIACPFRLDP